MAIKKAAKKKTVAKKKAPAKKKVVAKKVPAKKAAKKKPVAKRMSQEQKDYLVTKISAIYWEQFGRGAELPIEPDCIDRAVELGSLANIRKNIKELSTFGTLFTTAEGCSFKAGKRAKFLAGKQRPMLKTITPEIYQEAFEYVAESITRLAARSKKQGSKIAPEGILC
jgi:hypothetical protein